MYLQCTGLENWSLPPVDDEGSPASESASQMGGDGGGADGGGQQRRVGLGWKQR